MHHQQVLVRLDRQFVLHDAILRNTYAIKAGTDGADTSYEHRAFQRRHDPRNHRARRKHRADTGDGKEGRSEQQSPETSPESPGLAPVLHAVAAIVEAHRLLLGVGILARSEEHTSELQSLRHL